jgi:catechol 2,3-dioxygenase-like lactoylglutathione lyase family enzyme
MPQPVVTPPAINCIAPCFIVQNAPASAAFYCDKLGFDVTFQAPEQDPFFFILCRGGAMLMLKAVGVSPAPNRTQHPWARWDAYINAPDPDALAEEFTSRGVLFSEPLKDTNDGLRGFELHDADGYTIFFGRPLENSN